MSLAETRTEIAPGVSLAPERPLRVVPELGRPARAVVLLSGGLDSALAAVLVRREGVEVRALHLYTGFCITEAKRQKGDRARNPALSAAAALNVPIEMRDISDKYIEIVTRPKFGYGANANPCVDCRGYMLRRAREYGDEIGADFYVTGEVLGQRPKSQRRDTLDIVRREGGMEDLLLRPLTAGCLPPTRPEREGWVRREAMQRISGRSRKGQIHLARLLGIDEYAQPAGGCCFLADESYARRFFDHLDHKAERTLTPEEVLLLGTGRHFRLGERLVAICGRNEGENRFLERHRAGRWSFEAEGAMGPLVILYGEGEAGAAPGADGADEKALHRAAAAIVARYAHGSDAARTEVPVRAARDLETRIISVVPARDEELDEIRIS